MPNANTKMHTFSVWGVWHQLTEEQKKIIQKWEEEDGNDGGASINTMIRRVRRLKKWGHSATNIDISITIDQLACQWNDGIEMSITSLDRIDALLADLLLLRKWFNAPRPELS